LTSVQCFDKEQTIPAMGTLPMHCSCEFIAK